MKSLLALAFACALCCASAQNGKIYRTFDDLLNDRGETIPDLLMKPPVDDAVFGRQGYLPVSKFKTNKELKQQTMFAVVRDTLYVNLGALEDSTKKRKLCCVPAERLDRYVFFRNFSSEQMVKIVTYGVMFGLVGESASYDREKGRMAYYCLDLTSGQACLVDENSMPELLKGYPDLLQDYLREPEPDQRKTLERYVGRFREYKLAARPETPDLQIDGRNGTESIPEGFRATTLYASVDDYLNGRYEIVPGVRLAGPDSTGTGKRASGTLTPVSDDIALVGKLKNRTFIIATGDSLYVNCRKLPTSDKGYAPAERFGDLVFCRLRPSMKAVLPETAEADGTQDDASDPARENGPYWFYTNLRTGETRVLDSGCMYALLDEYPDLLERYLAETEPNDKQTLESYLDLFRQRKDATS